MGSFVGQDYLMNRPGHEDEVLMKDLGSISAASWQAWDGIAQASGSLLSAKTEHDG